MLISEQKEESLFVSQHSRQTQCCTKPSVVYKHSDLKIKVLIFCILINSKKFLCKKKLPGFVPRTKIM